MYAKLINLTPHAITIYEGDRVLTTVERHGAVARVKVTRTTRGSLDIGEPKRRTGDTWPEVPLSVPAFGQVEDLPEPVGDTYFIVSALVREAVKYRSDVLSPGEPIRNDAGVIIGCRGLDANP